eukprot:TRINITY_DN12980_c0_g1_i1.p1 TRINITY_DN12980_c0_g1~~TRINITY_DN12980_c0_g1_i1.p1  ORF type:complete len:488 (+),score=92.02 TRINITY_DN12980_c0_g1_i1:44-1507(+)
MCIRDRQTGEADQEKFTSAQLEEEVGRKKVEIFFKKPENLPGVDRGGKSDPYFICAHSDFKTSTKKKTTNPVWDPPEKSEHNIRSPLNGFVLRYKCFDWNRITKDQEIGHFSISSSNLKGIKANEEKEEWFNLSKQGRVLVGIKFIDWSPDTVREDAIKSLLAKEQEALNTESDSQMSAVANLIKKAKEDVAQVIAELAKLSDEEKQELLGEKTIHGSVEDNTPRDRLRIALYVQTNPESAYSRWTPSAKQQEILDSIAAKYPAGPSYEEIQEWKAKNPGPRSWSKAMQHPQAVYNETILCDIKAEEKKLVPEKEKFDNVTPIRLAGKAQDLDMLAFLLELGAPTSFVDSKFSTEHPLEASSREADATTWKIMIQLFVEYGFDINNELLDEKNLLRPSLYNSKCTVEMIDFFLRLGFDPHLGDKDGNVFVHLISEFQLARDAALVAKLKRIYPELQIAADMKYNEFEEVIKAFKDPEIRLSGTDVNQ